jgi:hypothetical protein
MKIDPEIRSAWSAPVMFENENNAYGKYSLPFVATGSGDLVFLHSGPTPTSGIRISRSENGGSAWTHAALDGTDWDSGYIAWSSLAVQAESVYAVYTKRRSDGAFQFIFNKSIDGGATW